MVMREYSKRQEGEENTFENIRKTMGRIHNNSSKPRSSMKKQVSVRDHVVWKRLSNSKIILVHKVTE